MSHINSTITAGATAQVGVAADPRRSYLLVQNNDAAEDLWINFETAAATDTGIKIPAGGSGAWTRRQLPDITGNVSIIGATTGHKYGITTHAGESD